MGNKRFIPLTVVIALSFFSLYAQDEQLKARKLLVFYSPHCHRCMEAKAQVLPGIEKRYKGRLQIEYLDTADMQNYKLLLALKAKHNARIAHTLPVFYFEGRFADGSGPLKKNLEALISRGDGALQQQNQGLPAIDLFARFAALTPLAVAGAGLIDGINPCAFTVIVFFVSFLALQGYRRAKLAVIGLFFILAVLLTYLSLGLGIFGFLYRLSGFWMIARSFNIAIGLACFILGSFALYDSSRFLITRKTTGLILQLPEAVKRQIHKVIGLRYRNTQDTRAGSPRHSFLGLAGGAMLTGFLVSILEAVCTGQVYLPTITFVLKTAQYNLKAWGYLLLYNLMFILPLFAVLAFALLGATSDEFSGFLRRHLLTVKLLMAALFFFLGIFLIMV